MVYETHGVHVCKDQQNVAEMFKKNKKTDKSGKSGEKLGKRVKSCECDQKQQTGKKWPKFVRDCPQVAKKKKNASPGGKM